jgi:hypothetical protein
MPVVPATREAEVEGLFELRSSKQLGLYSEILFQKEKDKDEDKGKGKGGRKECDFCFLQMRIKDQWVSLKSIPKGHYSFPMDFVVAISKSQGLFIFLNLFLGSRLCSVFQNNWGISENGFALIIGS